jgi:hypothetical protein
MEGKTQTKFQPFGVELLACRDRIELESSDLSISSRNNCFLRDNRSCEAHGPREFAMKKAVNALSAEGAVDAMAAVGGHRESG